LVSLRAEVRASLARHGVAPTDDDTPATLKERLNDRYLEDVRRLRERQRAEEIPMRDYADRVRELRNAYSLLGLPLELWVEAKDPARSTAS
jgi:hypothetical protein